MPNDVPIPPGMKLLLGGILIGAIVLWAVVARRIWHRQSVVRYEPRRPVPWGANDLVLVILLVVLMGFVTLLAMARLRAGQSDDVESEAGYYVSSFIQLAGVALGVFILKVQAGADRRDCGFDTTRLISDLGLGAAAYLVSVVPVYGIQEFLTRFVTYTHQVLKSLHAHPDARMFIATAVAALVAAPLFEEFLFRVLLQGWFESLESRRRILRLGLSGEGPAWWPILLSSFFFAAMHWNNGLAVIPLFFFAIALGYIYQRTHRIWPSLVTHFLLNAGTMLVLWFQMQHPGK